MTQPGGYIYAIRGTHPSFTKIGVTTEPPAKRLRSLQSSHPEPLHVLAAVLLVQNGRRVERQVHKLLASQRVQGEWFDLPDFTQADLRDVVSRAQQHVIVMQSRDPVTPVDTLGGRIRHTRKTYGMTQRTLAQRSGVSYQALNYLENGYITDPRVSTLMAIARALDVTTDYLLDMPGQDT